MTEHNEHQTFKADEIPCQEISDPVVLSKNPLVSVHMITYNHEPYIAQAIEGVLMQETDFPIELIIGEDCSTDRTREIVLEYQKKHPDIIREVTSGHNVGMIKNCLRTIKACRGKYIAFCEGDDYWTDPKKLQMQVDFLDSHPDFALCIHNVKVINEGTGSDTFITRANPKTECTIEDVIEYSYPLPTCGTIIRNGLVRSLPAWFSEIHNADWALQILASQFGKLYCMDDPMGTHIQHKGGISVTTSIEYQNDHLIKLLHLINEHLDFKYRIIINKLLARALMSKSRLLLKKHRYIKAVEYLLQAFFTSPRACVRRSYLFVSQKHGKSSEV